MISVRIRLLLAHIVLCVLLLSVHSGAMIVVVPAEGIVP